LLLIYSTHKAAKTALGGIAHAWRTASHVFHFAEIFFRLLTLSFAGEYNGIQKQYPGPAVRMKKQIANMPEMTFTCSNLLIKISPRTF
jgi:hypothetical protein